MMSLPVMCESESGFGFESGFMAFVGWIRIQIQTSKPDSRKIGWIQIRIRIKIQMRHIWIWIHRKDSGFGFGFKFVYSWIQIRNWYLHYTIELHWICRIRIQSSWIRIRIQEKLDGFGFVWIRIRAYWIRIRIRIWDARIRTSLVWSSHEEGMVMCLRILS